MNKKWIRKIPIVIGLAAIAATAFSGIVMLLWNGVLTPVLHLSVITIWQAAGILLLSKILFGGFKGRRPMAGMWWKRRMMMKWKGMSPEERDAFKAKMESRCNRFGRDTDSPFSAA